MKKSLCILMLSTTIVAFAANVQQTEINSTVNSGVAYLLKKQKRNGSWEGPGKTALVVFTLLKSGVNPKTRAIRAGFSSLWQRPPRTTYGVSLTIMALDYYRRKVPKFPKRMQLLLKVMVKKLLAARSNDYWSYSTHSSSKDLSNTQFAVFALRSAVRLGVKISDKIWLRLLEALLRAQKNGHEVVGVIGGSKNEYYKSDTQHYARGWGYTAKASSTGSMTAAGVCCLLIIREHLSTTKKYARAHKMLTKGIEDGMAWLALHFTVETNPSRSRHHKNWHYYYLYGLERVGSLIGWDLIGRFEWYALGASYLVRHQRDGHWKDMVTTCFALLFLVKATLPATLPVKETIRIITPG
ncbi:hypothetical protein [Candidatus Uabimicrobium amorphum]|uniref:Squalene cyclase C-terminal domain-containing protein n=1 Tax=Uabimicrobium amorphum TaxID=2596890 RepID=A0A5S9IKP4_UABAM|nr:hypothetical protein [Candidatus Uabimicrobium amorphum]BBM82830.1 hypothetical protein UABAM_01173 [Candidatus Uabimicrobium amorphum]